jgi:hypothetical protein
VSYADESMRQRRDRSGLYAIAAPILEAERVDALRSVITILARGKLPFHWREAGARVRRNAIEVVAELDVLQFVVVGTGLDNARQERHRRLCLRRLLWELEQFGVSHLRLDARRPGQDTADRAAIAAWRAQQVIGSELRVDHVSAREEPLIWMADIVAGAVTTARGDGDNRFLKPLEAQLHEVTITLD